MWRLARRLPPGAAATAAAGGPPRIRRSIAGVLLATPTRALCHTCMRPAIAPVPATAAAAAAAGVRSQVVVPRRSISYRSTSRDDSHSAYGPSFSDLSSSPSFGGSNPLLAPLADETYVARLHVPITPQLKFDPMAPIPELLSTGARYQAAADDPLQLGSWLTHKSHVLPRELLRCFNSTKRRIKPVVATMVEQHLARATNTQQTHPHEAPEVDAIIRTFQLTPGHLKYRPEGAPPKGKRVAVLEEDMAQRIGQWALDCTLARLRMTLVQLRQWSLLERFDQSTRAIDVRTLAAKSNFATPRRQGPNSSNGASHSSGSGGDANRDGSGLPHLNHPMDGWSFQDWCHLESVERRVLEAFSTADGRSSQGDGTLEEQAAEKLRAVVAALGEETEEDRRQAQAASERASTSPYTLEGRARLLPDAAPFPASIGTFSAVDELRTLAAAPMSGLTSSLRVSPAASPPTPTTSATGLWKPRLPSRRKNMAMKTKQLDHLHLQLQHQNGTLSASTANDFAWHVELGPREGVGVPSRMFPAFAPFSFLAPFFPTIGDLLRETVQVVRAEEMLVGLEVKRERDSGLVFRVGRNDDRTSDTQVGSSSSSASSPLVPSPLVAAFPAIPYFPPGEYRLDYIFARLEQEEHALSLLSRAWVLELECLRRTVLPLSDRRRQSQTTEDALVDSLSDELRSSARRRAGRKKDATLHPEGDQTARMHTTLRSSRMNLQIREYMELYGMTQEEAQERVVTNREHAQERAIEQLNEWKAKREQFEVELAALQQANADRVAELKAAKTEVKKFKQQQSRAGEAEEDASIARRVSMTQAVARVAELKAEVKVGRARASLLERRLHRKTRGFERFVRAAAAGPADIKSERGDTTNATIKPTEEDAGQEEPEMQKSEAPTGDAVGAAEDPKDATRKKDGAAEEKEAVAPLLVELPPPSSSSSSSASSPPLPLSFLHRPMPLVPSDRRQRVPPRENRWLSHGASSVYHEFWEAHVGVIEGLEGLIRMWVREKKATGEWDRLLHQRLAQLREAGRVSPPAWQQRFVGLCNYPTVEQRLQWTAHGVESTMPEHVIDLFLAYRTRPAIPYTLLDDLLREKQEKQEKRDEEEAEATEDSHPPSGRRAASSLAVDSDLQLPLSPYLNLSLDSLRARLRSVEVLGDVGVVPNLSPDERRRVVDLAAARVFYHHLYHLNPAVTKEIDRVLEIKTLTPPAGTDDSAPPPTHESASPASSAEDKPALSPPAHDDSNYAHFLRPASVRSGLHCLPQALALNFLPEPLLRQSTRLQWYPWLTWDTWCRTIQGAYALVFPNSVLESRRATSSRATRELDARRSRYARLGRVEGEGEVDHGQTDAGSGADGADGAGATDGVVADSSSSWFESLSRLEAHRLPPPIQHFESAADALDFLERGRLGREAVLLKQHRATMATLADESARAAELRRHAAAMAQVELRFRERCLHAEKARARDEARRTDAITPKIDDVLTRVLLPQARDALVAAEEDGGGDQAAMQTVIKLIQACLRVEEIATAVRAEGTDAAATLSPTDIQRRLLTPLANDRPLHLTFISYFLVPRVASSPPSAASGLDEDALDPTIPLRTPIGAPRFLLTVEHVRSAELQRVARAIQHCLADQPLPSSSVPKWSTRIHRFEYIQPDFWLEVDMGEVHLRCFTGAAPRDSVAGFNRRLAAHTRTAAVVGVENARQRKVVAVAGEDIALDDQETLARYGARVNLAKIAVKRPSPKAPAATLQTPTSPGTRQANEDDESEDDSFEE